MNTNIKLALLAIAISFAAPGSHAAVVRYEAVLAPEVTGATGSGFTRVDYDNVAHTLNISANWSGLSGLTTVSHIHCCTTLPGLGTIGVAVTPGTLPGFPSGVSAGSYSRLIDLTLATSYTAAFINNFAGGLLANAEGALIAGFDDGKAYLNIHSDRFPAGEIRGFLQQVPEPGTIFLTLLGLAGMGGLRRKATSN